MPLPKYSAALASKKLPSVSAFLPGSDLRVQSGGGAAVSRRLRKFQFCLGKSEGRHASQMRWAEHIPCCLYGQNCAPTRCMISDARERKRMKRAMILLLRNDAEPFPEKTAPDPETRFRQPEPSCSQPETGVAQCNTTTAATAAGVES